MSNRGFSCSRVYFAVLGLIFVINAVAAEINIGSVKKRSVAEQLSFNGTVEAINKGTASAQTSGRVEATYFDVGDIVEKNALILRLEDKTQKAALENAKANTKIAKALSLSAEKEFLRIEDVFKKKLVSRSVFDKALAQRDSTRAKLMAAAAKEKNAQVQLDYTKIKAPYSGIVLKRYIEVGEIVSPGTAVYSGMSLENLRVLTEIPQKDINIIREFKHAVIELSEKNKIDVMGADLTFFGYADPNTTTFKVRVKLPTGLSGLYPGMYLKTNFQVGQKQLLSVPKSSIIHRGEVTAVYVAVESKDAHTPSTVGYKLRQVRLGQSVNDEDIEVVSGVLIDEKIVLNPDFINTQLDNFRDLGEH